MKNVIILYFLIALIGCSDNPIESRPSDRSLKLDMALEGVYRFESYINSLTIYAFAEQGDGKYVYYATLAELNQADINGLAPGSSGGGSNLTNSKLLEAQLPAARYRIYIVANVQPDASGGFVQGVTRPEDVFMAFPQDGLFNSYFSGQTDADVGNGSTTIPIVLHRVISQVFLKLEGIPSQLETVTLLITNIANKVYIDGSLSKDAITVSEVYKVKVENSGEFSSAFFQQYTFPTTGTISDIQLLFLSKSGEKDTVTLTKSMLLPDKYLQLNAEINHDFGSTLSFNVNVTFFRTHNWRDVELPDFPLNGIK